MNFNIVLRKRILFAALVLLLLLPFACQGATRAFAPHIPVSPDSPATRELFWLAGRVSGAEIEELIRSGADVDARHDGYTPLMRVVFRVALLDVLEAMTRTGYRSETPLPEKSEALHTLDVLVAAGADIDAPQDADGNNALMALTEWYLQRDFANFEDIFERLLDLGSAPEYKNKEGRTVLMTVAEPISINPRHKPCLEKEAARADRTSFVLERLLQAGGNLRTTDHYGETALMRAFSGQWNFAAIQKLIDAGSDINAKDKSGIGVFMKALDKIKKNKTDSSWLTDRRHNRISSRPQIEQPDSIILWDDDLITSLDTLNRLMDLGIAPDALRTSDDTALTITVQTEGKEGTEKYIEDFLEELLKRYEWSSNEKNDALFHSVFPQQFNCGRIERLVRHGTDINTRDATGKNVLMVYLTNDYPRYGPASSDLERLIALGFDIGVRDNEGSNLLTLGQYPPLRPDVIKILIDCGIDVNTANDAGLTPLLGQMRGYQAGYPEAIRMLLEAGANPNVPDRNGNPPIILSLDEWESSRIMAILLTHGANPDAKNAKGQTPLMLLARQSPMLMTGFRVRDVFSVLSVKMEMLLAHGADIDVLDTHGKTVWNYAVENHDRRMLHFLLAAAKSHHRIPPEWILHFMVTGGPQ